MCKEYNRKTIQSEDNNALVLTLRVSRFTPITSNFENQEHVKQEFSNTQSTNKVHKRKHKENPFAKTKHNNPFSKLDESENKKLQGKHWIQDYTICAHENDTILDCLLKIKRTLDPTLAFRYSCGHGVCGSDAANVNGMPTLLCTATIREHARNTIESSTIKSHGFRKTGSKTNNSTNDLDNTNSTTNSADDSTTESTTNSTTNKNTYFKDAHNNFGIIELSPLSGFTVQRDLICDITPMISQIKRLEPYLQANNIGNINILEFLQNPQELQKFELLSNCILCGACEGVCPIYASGEAFIGPAALVNAARFIYDSRDNAGKHRLDLINSADGISACQSVRACSKQCPRGIDIGEEIWQLTTLANEKS